MKATFHHFTERGREEQTKPVTSAVDAILWGYQLLEQEDAPSAIHIVFDIDAEPISVFQISKVAP